MTLQMKFCLASQNHQAPGPQTWKYIRAGGEKACTTDTITLEVAADEVWKMMVDDEIDIEKNKPQTTISGEKGKFVQFKAYRRIGDRESIGR